MLLTSLKKKDLSADLPGVILGDKWIPIPSLTLNTEQAENLTFPVF